MGIGILVVALIGSWSAGGQRVWRATSDGDKCPNLAITVESCLQYPGARWWAIATGTEGSGFEGSKW